MHQWWIMRHEQLVEDLRSTAELEKKQMLDRQRIRESGGFITIHEPKKGALSLVSVRFPGREIREEDLQLLLVFPRLWHLEIEQPAWQGGGLAVLQRLEELSSISLGRRTSDAHIARIGEVRSLETLYLRRSRITDSGLEYLRPLTNLRSLELEGTSINDSGLRNLEGLTNLQHLSLANTHITDAGLDYLVNLHQLRVLHMHGTAVTEARIANLRKQLPNVTVMTDP